MQNFALAVNSSAYAKSPLNFDIPSAPSPAPSPIPGGGGGPSIKEPAKPRLPFNFLVSPSFIREYYMPKALGIFPQPFIAPFTVYNMDNMTALSLQIYMNCTSNNNCIRNFCDILIPRSVITEMYVGNSVVRDGIGRLSIPDVVKLTDSITGMEIKPRENREFYLSCSNFTNSLRGKITVMATDGTKRYSEVYIISQQLQVFSPEEKPEFVISDMLVSFSSNAKYVLNFAVVCLSESCADSKLLYLPIMTPMSLSIPLIGRILFDSITLMDMILIVASAYAIFITIRRAPRVGIYRISIVLVPILIIVGTFSIVLLRGERMMPIARREAATISVVFFDKSGQRVRGGLSIFPGQTPEQADYMIINTTVRNTGNQPINFSWVSSYPPELNTIYSQKATPYLNVAPNSYVTWSTASSCIDNSNCVLPPEECVASRCMMKTQPFEKPDCQNNPTIFAVQVKANFTCSMRNMSCLGPNGMIIGPGVTGDYTMEGSTSIPICPEVAPPVIIFSDDFSSGDASRWDSNITKYASDLRVSSSMNATVSTPYAISTTFNGGHSTITKKFESQTDLYTRFYFNLKDTAGLYNWTHASSPYPILMATHVFNNTNNSFYANSVFLWKTSNKTYIGMRVYRGYDKRYTFNFTANEVSNNTWYCAEFRTAKGSGNGASQLWVNGTQIFSWTELNNSDVGFLDKIRLGIDASAVDIVGGIGNLRDGTSDIMDTATISASFGYNEGGVKYKPEADITSDSRWIPDGMIDIMDNAMGGKFSGYPQYPTDPNSIDNVQILFDSVAVSNSTIGCEVSPPTVPTTTTIVSTTTTTTTTTVPTITLVGNADGITTLPLQRSICKDNQGILHTAWRYNTTAVYYANSTDGVTWRVNSTFFTGDYQFGRTAATGRSFTHVSCDGNNITVLWQSEGPNDGIVAVSGNNGASWSYKNPATGDLFNDYGVERRGQRIYMVWRDMSTDNTIKFMNSSDGGTTWGSVKNIMVPATTYDMIGTSIAVDGNGGVNDRIYVVAREQKSTTDADLYFVNSTNSGTTWGTKTKISDVVLYSPSITFSGSNLYVAGYEPNAYAIYFLNSTNYGITWTTPYQINLTMANGVKAYYASATIDNNYPWVFWNQNSTNANHDLVYRRYNGINWSDLVFLTNNNFGNNYVNTPYRYYNDNKVHYVWRNGTSSPYQILYSNVPFA